MSYKNLRPGEIEQKSNINYAPVNKCPKLERKKKIRDFIYFANALACDDQSAEEKCRQLARELFPPMAKPLVWRNPHGPYTSGDYMIAPDCNGAFRATYNLSQIFAFKGAAREALDQCKAACEAHHQARFLEQLA